MGAGAIIQDMARRTERLSLLAALVETFDTPADRACFIARLRKGGFVSRQVAELMLETYAREAAQ
jgi:hypothetical protein